MCISQWPGGAYPEATPITICPWIPEREKSVADAIDKARASMLGAQI